jgi:hypothetical protein
MQIETYNQDTPDRAEAIIRVGCGLDGDEATESFLTYSLSPNGLWVSKTLENGDPAGNAHLSLQDLEVICKTPGITHEEALESRDRLFPGEAGVLMQAPNVSCFQGEVAEDRLKELLNAASSDDATGTIWVLMSSLGAWADARLKEFSLEELQGAEMVVIDSGNSQGDAWKYTYYPTFKMGLFIYETP